MFEIVETVLKRIDAVADQFAQLMTMNNTRLDALGAEMTKQYHSLFEALQNAPKGEIPTVEEMLEQAKTDPKARKELELTLAQLEFESPQIEMP